MITNDRLREIASQRHGRTIDYRHMEVCDMAAELLAARERIDELADDLLAMERDRDRVPRRPRRAQGGQVSAIDELRRLRLAAQLRGAAWVVAHIDTRIAELEAAPPDPLRAAAEGALALLDRLPVSKADVAELTSCVKELSAALGES